MTSETTRIPHDGGANPVREGEALVKVWFRGGSEAGISVGGDGCDLTWAHKGLGADIIAYAVMPERAPSPPAQEPTMDAIEVVARALADLEIDNGEGGKYRLFELLDFSGENQTRIVIQAIAQAALAAARPFVAAECAKVALKLGNLDDDDVSIGQAIIAKDIATAIEETIR